MSEQNTPTNPVLIILADGKERYLRYTVKSMRRLRDKFGKSIMTGEALRSLDEEKIPELIYEGLTDKEGVADADAVADMIDTRQLKYVIETFSEAFSGAHPEKNAISPTPVQ